MGADATTSPDFLFRAFSDRTRLRILNLLQSGGREETCVCDLVRVMGASQPKISRHLAYLRRAGLVEGRKEGLWVYYRLARAGSPFHRSLLKCLGTCFGSVPELRRDLGRAGGKKGRCAGECCG